jgi:hypothetical protein
MRTIGPVECPPVPLFPAVPECKFDYVVAANLDRRKGNTIAEPTLGIFVVMAELGNVSSPPKGAQLYIVLI